MHKSVHMICPLFAAAIVALSLAQASTITRADYDAEKDRIGVEYKSDGARCDTLAGIVKDVCVQEAKATQKVALADLEYRFTGTKSDGRNAMTARAEGNYAVAREKCDAKAGNDKDVCVQEAKAVQTKAIAEVTLGKAIGDARTDAANDGRDADYKVAIERCDSYAGETKTSCIHAAKVKFDKS